MSFDAGKTLLRDEYYRHPIDEDESPKVMKVLDDIENRVSIVLKGSTLILEDYKTAPSRKYVSELMSEEAERIKQNVIQEEMFSVERRLIAKSTKEKIEFIITRGRVDSYVISDYATDNREDSEWIEEFICKRGIQLPSQAERDYLNTYEFLDRTSGGEMINKHIIDFQNTYPGRKLLINIAAPSNAGKTDIVTELTNRFPCLVITTDNAYRGKTYMEAHDITKHGKLNFDDKRALNHEGYKEILSGILKGNITHMNEYDFKQSEPSANTISLDPTGKNIIIAEGIFNFQEEFSLSEEELGGAGILNIAIIAKGNELPWRRVKRDVERKSHSPVGIFRYYNEFVEDAYTESILPSLKNAQMHIHNMHNPSYQK